MRRPDPTGTVPVARFAVITAREASVLAALADAAAAPEPPLPPVAATDAAVAFDAWLAAAPRRNQLALRGALLALERLSGRRHPTPASPSCARAGHPAPAPDRSRGRTQPSWDACAPTCA